MDDTPNLLLPFILAAQSQKHVTHNEALRKLDVLVQLAVLDRDLATPPASPANGARYIVAAAPTGAWAGQAGKIAAYQDGAWAFYAPSEGWLSWVADENVVVIWSGSAWTPLPGGGGGGGVTDHGALTGLADDDHPHYHNNARGDTRYTPINPATLGVNATADATNKFAVNSPAILLNHAGAGHQVKINKNAAADTASVLYQTGFSGRAEFGTTGDDNFHVKVSADGTTFQEAIVINRTTGAVDMPLTGPDIQAFTTAGAHTWTKPAWAHANSVVEIHMLGGGGGGGSGRRGAAASVRCGGGGGGGGYYTLIKTKAADFGATVNVTVGAGGTGGAAQTVNATNGVNGVVGGSSFFGTNYRGFGATFGNGGSATAGAGGAQGGVNGPFSTIGAAGGSASTTGAVGVAPAATAATGALASGGGSGGGVTSANAVSSGGAGAAATANYFVTTAVGGLAGSSGGNGGNGNSYDLLFDMLVGSGGGGGASSITANAGNGGNGGPGGGGGGGGAALDGFNSGAGGNGGAGWVVVVTYR